MRKGIPIIFFCYFSVFCFGQVPQQKLTITPLTGDFYVYTTYQPYKGDLVSANGLYVVTNNGVILIDTPWDTTQFQPLLDSIQIRHHQWVALCVATHSHNDRTAGLEFYRKKGIQTFTSRQTDAICKKTGSKRAQFTFKNDTTFHVGQYSFQTYYAGAAHTHDNIFIWFEKNKVLYGGCAIKSAEATDLGYIGEADVTAWPTTLKKVKQKFPRPAFIVPGHQDWNSLNSIDHTLDLLKKGK